MASSTSFIVFQKELYKFQVGYLKELMSKIDSAELMTPELTELFDKEISELDTTVKENIKKKKTKKKTDNKPKEKTPRQILLTENMTYIRSKYNDVKQTDVMTCSQYMTTKMTNDPEMTKYDALMEAIEMVNTKKGCVVFEKIPKE